MSRGHHVRLARTARAERDNVLARYDYGALNPGIAAYNRAICADIAWAEHRAAMWTGIDANPSTGLTRNQS